MSNYFAAQVAALTNNAFLTATPTPSGSGTMNVNDLGPLKALDGLKILLLAIISVIGVIIVVKNIGEIGPAIQQQDSGTINHAIKGIVGGAIMAFAGPILGFLGFVV